MTNFILKNIFLLCIVAFFASCGTTSGIRVSNSKNISTWEGETSGTLGFKAESPLYKADAKFRSWVFGKLNVPNNDILQLSATIYVDINSVYERTIRLTKDLKAPAYLNGEDYPMAEAIISNVEHIEGDNYKAKVLLVLKDIKKELTTKFVLTKVNGKMHVVGEIDLFRKDFKVGDEKMESVKNEVLIYYDTDLK